MIKNPIIAGRGIKLPELTIPGTAADLLAPKQLIDADGNVLTGTMPEVDQATPAITVSSTGLITAAAVQTAGYVAEGTKSATKQLTTKAAATIIPGAANQTIAAGTYLTGAQTIKGDANLLAANIKSGVSIFGVAGAFTGSNNAYVVQKTYTTDTSGEITFSLPFTPSTMVVCCDSYNLGTATSTTYYLYGGVAGFGAGDDSVECVFIRSRTPSCLVQEGFSVSGNDVTFTLAAGKVTLYLAAGRTYYFCFFE